MSIDICFFPLIAAQNLGPSSTGNSQMVGHLINDTLKTNNKSKLRNSIPNSSQLL
jgi:hypothetical protein